MSDSTNYSSIFESDNDPLLSPNIYKNRRKNSNLSSIFSGVCLIITPFLIFLIISAYVFKQNTILISQNDTNAFNNILFKFNQTQEMLCKPTDYEKVIKFNSHVLPKTDYTYENICKDKNECLPKLLKIEHGQHYWASSKTKTLACVIRKNMSQVLKSILCFLNDELKFLYSGRDLIRDAFSHDCKENHFIDLKSVANKNITRRNDWSYIAIVRDPVDRFLSGFIHMCINGVNSECTSMCHGCGPNMTCYIERQFSKIKQMSKNLNDFKTDEATEHTYPQSWRCNFNENLKDYLFLKYNIDSQLFYPVLHTYFASKNVSDQALQYIKAKMISTRTGHATALMPIRSFLEQRLRSSSYLMNMLIKMYYYDYKLFGFDLPKITKS